MTELCCCEYYDIDGERSHILGCCCNCYQLDESFERLITCRAIPQYLKHTLMQTLGDRMRIPWYGGAKQISIGLPCVYVPILILVATLSFTSTIIVAIIATLIVWIASKSAMMLPKFFVLWMGISLAIILGVFEIYTVPWLLIMPQENMLAIGLIVITLIAIAKIHYEVKGLKEGISSEKTAYYCQFCQIYRSGGTAHKYWVDTCVIPSTYKYYLLATATCSGGLLYMANLNLTTVCHPFRPFEAYSFLLPDDCGEVYESFAIALPFVTALYSTAIGLLLLFELIVNILGYTQCFGMIKLIRILFTLFCGLLCCLRRPASKTSPKINI